MKDILRKNRKYFSAINILVAGFFLALLVAVPFAVRSRTIVVDTPPFTATVENPFEAPGVVAGTATASSPSKTIALANDSGAGSVLPVQKITNTLPLKLIIPSLGIKSNIQSVGLTPKGDMDIAHSAVDVAWYKLGPRPGEVGSAVINGHINTYYSDHGVFEHLDQLNAGDVVMVEQMDGKILRFVVTGKKILAYDAPSDEVFAPTSERRLNLITCAGEWMKDKQLYTERLVVFTKLEQ